MKSLLYTIVLVIFSFLNSFSQDILVLKKNGGAMEGYLQRVTKEQICVRFGIYEVSLKRKNITIIYGKYYSLIKSKGMTRYLHEIDQKSPEIVKSAKKSRRLIRLKQE